MVPWDILQSQWEVGRLAHALLFSGKSDEKDAVAMRLAQLVNCRQASSEPCGSCQSCRMIAIGTFADLVKVNSLQSGASVKEGADRGEIDVGQIRRMQEFLQRTSYYGGYKTVIVEQAERMNVQAQNCLLKSLEEPRGKTLIMLEVSHPDLLLATIVSRCQHLVFADSLRQDRAGEFEELWQAAMAGMPEKFRFAKQADLENGSFEAMLDALEQKTRNLLLGKLGIIPAANGSDWPLGKITRTLSAIGQMRKLSGTTNLNKKMALEIILLA